MGARDYDRFGLTRPVTVPIGPIVADMTVSVKLTGARKAAWRIQIARWLFWLGARVAGMNGKVEIE